MRNRTARARRTRWLRVAMFAMFAMFAVLATFTMFWASASAAAVTLALDAGSHEPSVPTFNIMPTRIVIKGRETTASLLLRNDSKQTVRFQVTAFQWSNDRDSQIVLKPTTDLVFFPTLFTVEPGQSRRLRVAASQRAVERELTYRLLIEQLPSHAEAQPTGVQMLMRASVPVFVQPPTLVARAAIEHTEIADGRVSFDVRNLGTTHVMIVQADVRGVPAAGQAPYTQRLPGWYLLSGETRTYHVTLPPEVCRAQQKLTISITFDGKPQQTLTAEQPITAETCGR
jgi:fimbrial chaperone protein